MKKVSLDDIRLLVMVVQAGSLSRAAELTGIPVSRLSRRLTELETALGTQLMNRGKKGVSLNEVGKRFFEHGQNMLQQAQQALESVQENLKHPSGLLRLSIAGDVYHHLLAPLLPEYLSAYPEVRLDIQLTQQKIGMIQDGFDIAIRAGAVENDHVVAKPLTKLRFGIFASQTYLQQYGAPQSPNDLYRHQLVAQSLTLPWRFQKQRQTVEIMPMAAVAGNDFLLVEKLIQQGVGIGMLFTTAAKRYPELMEVLSDWQIPDSTLSLLYYKNRGAVPVVNSFAQWLVGKMEEAV